MFKSNLFIITLKPKFTGKDWKNQFQKKEKEKQIQYCPNTKICEISHTYMYTCGHTCTHTLTCTHAYPYTHANPRTSAHLHTCTQYVGSSELQNSPIIDAVKMSTRVYQDVGQSSLKLCKTIGRRNSNDIFAILTENFYEKLYILRGKSSFKKILIWVTFLDLPNHLIFVFFICLHYFTNFEHKLKYESLYIRSFFYSTPTFDQINLENLFKVQIKKL